MHPRLFDFGHLVLPAYGAMVALGTIFALLVCLRAARLLSLDRNKVWTLALFAIVVAVCTNKLLQVLVNWSRYGIRGFAVSLSNDDSFYCFLLSAAAALAACMIYVKKTHLPIRRVGDAFAPAFALGSCFASIGCLEAGCGYGTPTHLPWAIVFTNRLADPGTPLGVPLHPTQIYAAAIDFLLFSVLFWMLHRPHREGEILGVWLFLEGLAAASLSTLRGDGGHGAVFGGVLSLSQALGIAMIMLGGLLWLRQKDAALVLHAR